MIMSLFDMNAACDFCIASAWSLCYAIQIPAPVLHHHSIKLYMSCICSLTTVSNHLAELCWILHNMQSLARSTIKLCPQRVFCTLMYELWVCSASLERAFGLLLAAVSQSCCLWLILTFSPAWSWFSAGWLRRHLVKDATSLVTSSYINHIMYDQHPTVSI